jgi:hypothetical protein
MSTPSERIWAAFAADDRADLRDHLPARAARPETLANVARRVASGIPLRAAAADFMDDLRWTRDRADTTGRITQAPDPVDRRTDAYLAALAEHVAVHREVATPGWAIEQSRFLDHFWWPSTTKALRARAVVESPAAFRRRGIFIGATTLSRV